MSNGTVRRDLVDLSQDKVLFRVRRGGVVAFQQDAFVKEELPIDICMKARKIEKELVAEAVIELMEEGSTPMSARHYGTGDGYKAWSFSSPRLCQPMTLMRLVLWPQRIRVNYACRTVESC